MDVLITYDIATADAAGAKRLRRIATVCEKYGQRIQFSVFECRLTPARFAVFLTEIEEAIDPKQDSVIVYRFPGNIEDSKRRFGRTLDHKLGDPWIV